MKHIPQRMCVACRKMYPQNELIRLVRDNKTGEIKSTVIKNCSDVVLIFARI